MPVGWQTICTPLSTEQGQEWSLSLTQRLGHLSASLLRKACSTGNTGESSKHVPSVCWGYREVVGYSPIPGGNSEKRKSASAPAESETVLHVPYLSLLPRPSTESVIPTHQNEGVHFTPSADSHANLFLALPTPPPDPQASPVSPSTWAHP